MNGDYNYFRASAADLDFFKDEFSTMRSHSKRKHHTPTQHLLVQRRGHSGHPAEAANATVKQDDPLRAAAAIVACAMLRWDPWC